MLSSFVSSISTTMHSMVSTGQRNNSARENTTNDIPLVELIPKNMWKGLPKELVQKVFSYLDPISIAEASATCKSWRAAATDPIFKPVLDKAWALYDPRKDFPNVKIIDEAVWKAVFSPETLALHGLTFDDIEPLDGRTLRPLLAKAHALDFYGYFTVLTIPKGLSLNKLNMFVSSPKEGLPIAKFFTYPDYYENQYKRHFWNQLMQQLGNEQVMKTYRVVINSTTNKSYQENRKARLLGAQEPKVLQIATLISLTFMSSLKDPPECLFTGCTICSDIIGRDSAVVGGFTLDSSIGNHCAWLTMRPYYDNYVEGSPGGTIMWYL